MGVGEYIILNAQVFCVCVQLGKFALGSDKIQLYYGQELPVTMVVGVSWINSLDDDQVWHPYAILPGSFMSIFIIF